MVKGVGSLERVVKGVGSLEGVAVGSAWHGVRGTEWWEETK